MNYLAHALRHLDRPYFVAGVAVPDWMSVADRRVRARSPAARGLLDASDERVRETAAGIIQHHADDAWFHSTRAFAETSLSFAIQLRERLPGDEGFRPSFLGHILVELLLDAELMRDHPKLADRYYQTLQEISPAVVQQTVNRIARRPTDRLAPLIPHFITERFLYDYADDDKLFYRLGQVLRRVRLPALPVSLVPWLGSARRQVRAIRTELLTPPANASSLPAYLPLTSRQP
ncbi:MAG: hypothetical protein WD119_03090 [Pirellulaceae bacterium]